MELKDFITKVSDKCGNTKYIPIINEEQFNQVVLLIKKRNDIKKKMLTTSDKRSFDLVSNFLILEECCKAFKVNRLDMWFLIKELQTLLK